MLTSVTCAGEMAVYAPISGGYIHYIERWFHPAVGFAVGWQVCVQYCLFLPSEVIAANILISFWDTGERNTPTLRWTVSSPAAFPKSRQAGYMVVLILWAAGILRSCRCVLGS